MFKRGATAPYPADDEPVPGDRGFRISGEDPSFGLAEYESVRTDLLQGLSGQQSILAWSIAAIGVLFAAGMAIKPSDLAHASTLRELIFGAAIPLLATGACMAWLGEIFRMERDAHYLRLLERSTWTPQQRAANEVRDAWVGKTPLMLNAWVATSGGRNRVFGYVDSHKTVVVFALEILVLAIYLLPMSSEQALRQERSEVSNRHRLGRRDRSYAHR